MFSQSEHRERHLRYELFKQRLLALIASTEEKVAVWSGKYGEEEEVLQWLSEYKVGLLFLMVGLLFLMVGFMFFMIGFMFLMTGLMLTILSSPYEIRSGIVGGRSDPARVDVQFGQSQGCSGHPECTDGQFLIVICM